jgi:hypothetical protein
MAALPQKWGGQLACLAPVLDALPGGAKASLQVGGYQPPVQLLHGLLCCCDGGLAPLHHLAGHPVVGAVAQRMGICLQAAAAGGKGRRWQWRRWRVMQVFLRVHNCFKYSMGHPSAPNQAFFGRHAARWQVSHLDGRQTGLWQCIVRNHSGCRHR